MEWMRLAFSLLLPLLLSTSGGRPALVDGVEDTISPTRVPVFLPPSEEGGRAHDLLAGSLAVDKESGVRLRASPRFPPLPVEDGGGVPAPCRSRAEEFDVVEDAKEEVEKDAPWRSLPRSKEGDFRSSPDPASPSSSWGSPSSPSKLPRLPRGPPFVRLFFPVLEGPAVALSSSRGVLPFSVRRTPRPPSDCVLPLRVVLPLMVPPFPLEDAVDGNDTRRLSCAPREEEAGYKAREGGMAASSCC